METVAVGILVTEITGQAVWAALVAAAGFVPNALLGPLGGALADRVPRRRLLLATTAVQTILAGAAHRRSLRPTRPSRGRVTLIVLGVGVCGRPRLPRVPVDDARPRPARGAPGGGRRSAPRSGTSGVSIGPALAGHRDRARRLRVGLRDQHR